MTMVRVRSCIFSLFVVVLLLLVGDALSQDLSCFAIGCPPAPEDDNDGFDEPASPPSPEPTPSSPGDIPEISPGIDDPSPSPSPSPFLSPSPVGGGGGGAFFGGGGGGGGGRRPRRDRYSYKDRLASSSSNTAAAAIPQRPTRSRPTPSTGGQVITASGWTEIESG